MRRLSGMVLAGAMLMLPAFSLTGHAQEAAAQQPAAAAPPKTTYTGDAVIVMYAANPGKDADYEKVIATLMGALAKSTAPEAKQQLAGWKVMKNAQPQPDGSLVYIHIISPVVPEADYSITNIVYDVVKDPTEQKTFYDQYRGAVKAALFMIQGPLTADFGK